MHTTVNARPLADAKDEHLAAAEALLNVAVNVMAEARAALHVGRYEPLDTIHRLIIEQREHIVNEIHRRPTPSVIHVRYLAVQGRGDLDQIERYLSADARVVESMESDGNIFAVVRVEAANDIRAESDANLLAERYASGLYAAKVYTEVQPLLPIGANDAVWFLND
jgi:hypothetical protein